MVSAQTELIAAAIIIALGFLLARWAARYDVKGWVADAIWRVVARGGWRDLRKGDLKTALDRDGELRRQVSEIAKDIEAEAGTLGKARAAAKYGTLFAIAHAANVVAVPLLLIGVLLLGHSLYRLFA